jgi:ribose transport system ATP-binding protein
MTPRASVSGCKPRRGNTVQNNNDIAVLECRQLSKSFPGILACDRVDLSILQGEIHGIVGENGAGKSTLCNMITGVLPPSSGEIRFLGRQVRINHPSAALRLGIKMVYQERNLVPFLTGAQNICLGEEPRRGSLIDEKRMLGIAEDVKRKVDVAVPLDVPVSSLSASGQQMIEILRAVYRDSKLLILDEPTSSLTDDDAQGLFKLVRFVRDKNVAIIYISHKIEEILALCDRVTIMRDGKKITTRSAAELDRSTCIKLIANRDIQSLYPPVQEVAREEKILEVNDLYDESGLLKAINMRVQKREVVGLYGLVGSGRTEFAEVLFGLRAYARGEISYFGSRLPARASALARIHMGLFLSPEDRRRKGLFYENFDLRQNLSISQLDLLSTKFFGFVKREKEMEVCRRAAGMLDLKFRSFDQNIGGLSGGNKQKTLIGRWLTRPGCRLFIMDEPTQGVDVGTKYELYVLLRKLVEEEGLSVIFISSELPELIGVCDRMYVFKEGKITGELERKNFDQETILSYAL